MRPAYIFICYLLLLSSTITPAPETSISTDSVMDCLSVVAEKYEVTELEPAGGHDVTMVAFGIAYEEARPKAYVYSVDGVVSAVQVIVEQIPSGVPYGQFWDTVRQVSGAFGISEYTVTASDADGYVDEGCYRLFKETLHISDHSDGAMFAVMPASEIMPDNVLQMPIHHLEKRVEPTPTPYNDERISLSEYLLIHSGMDYAEVCDIIGSKGELTASASSGKYTSKIYKWVGIGSAGANAMIQFGNDEVTTKAQYGLK